VGIERKNNEYSGEIEKGSKVLVQYDRKERKKERIQRIEKEEESGKVEQKNRRDQMR